MAEEIESSQNTSRRKKNESQRIKITNLLFQTGVDQIHGTEPFKIKGKNKPFVYQLFMGQTDKGRP